MLSTFCSGRGNSPLSRLLGRRDKGLILLLSPVIPVWSWARILASFCFSPLYRISVCLPGNAVSIVLEYLPALSRMAFSCLCQAMASLTVVDLVSYGRLFGSHPSVVALRAATFAFVPNAKSVCIGAQIMLTRLPPSWRGQTRSYDSCIVFGQIVAAVFLLLLALNNCSEDDYLSVLDACWDAFQCRRNSCQLGCIWTLLLSCAKSDRVARDCFVHIIDPGVPYAAFHTHFTTPRGFKYLVPTTGCLHVSDDVPGVGVSPTLHPAIRLASMPMQEMPHTLR